MKISGFEFGVCSLSAEFGDPVDPLEFALLSCALGIEYSPELRRKVRKRSAFFRICEARLRPKLKNPNAAAEWQSS
jgi:hypothetical protein